MWNPVKLMKNIFNFAVLFLAFSVFTVRAVTLKAPDASGTTSFTGATNWSDGLAPHAGASYVVGVQYFRTPGDANNYTFAGSSLTITNGGGMIYKGSAVANTYTFNPLVLHNGGIVRSGAGSGNTMILAGTISVVSTNVTSQILADQSPYTINATISGPGALLFSGTFTTTVNGTNSGTGNTSVSGLMTQGTSGLMKFTIGGSGTNNSISGAGTATFNGRFIFDLSNASTNLGDSWIIATTTAKTFGATFSVDGFSRQGFGTGAGTWDFNTNGVNYEFVTSSGVLSVVAAPGNASAVSPAPTSTKFSAVDADLLAAYAPSYASSVGGEDNAQVLIANAVIGSNRDNDQSGTGAHLRIAAFYQSTNDVMNATSVGGIVNWLSGNDSHLADVVAYDAAVGADMVMYVCQDTDSSSIAGVSQQPGMYSSLSPSSVFHLIVAHETSGHGYGRSHSDGLLNPKTIMLHNYCGGGANAYFTNPKIWLNGVQLLGDGNNCSMGGLINGGDNSLPTADSAQGVADRRTRPVVGPNLNNVVLHWMFTNAPGLAPAGTTNLDFVSSAPAIVRGINATFTGAALRLPGGSTGNVAINSMAAYIDLPNGIVSSRTNITIEIWATPLSAPSYARVFDFGRPVQAGDGLGASGEYTGVPGSLAPGSTQSSDDIMLSYAIGTDITQQRFEAKLNGFATTLDAGLATTAGVPHHYAVTFTDGAGAAGANGGRWQWYRDSYPIAFLDVTNHLADIEDVNNWLGRSMWTDDAMANIDYTEVRISNVTMSRDEVLANFLLGPDYSPTTTVALTNSDASGASSFNAAGQWSSNAAPNAVNSYETYDFQLRTPATSTSYTFGGNTLKISGGSLAYRSTGGSTITVTNLILNGGVFQHSGSGTCTLAGNITVSTNGAEFNSQNGATTITAPISSTAPVTFLGNPVTLSGSNTGLTGKLLIGNGVAGAVQIDTESRLGPAPAAFTSDQLAFNRGTLVTTATMTLSNSNRGILLDVSGGTFNVASGTTLTLASTLSSPVTPGNVVAGALTKAGPGTLVLSTTNTTFKGTLFVDSGSTTANDGVVKIINNQALTNAHSPIFIRNNSGPTASSTLQLDGSAGGITLSQGVSFFGRNSSVPAIQSIAGTNTISGGLSINVGGGNYWIQSDAGWLNLGGTISSLATGARMFTFLGSGNLNVIGVIADGSATASVTKSGSGTLILAGANTYSGTTTLSAGALVVNGAVGTGGLAATGGTLSGVGTISGAVTMQSGAILAPGTNSIGTLNINNSLTLAAGSATRIKISKAGSSTANDAIAGLTSVSYSGALAVTNIGAGALTAGDTFKIFSSAAYGGTFTTITLPPLGAGLDWANRLTLDGTLSVVSTAPTNIVLGTSGPGLTLSWPAGYTGWRLLMQTGGLANGISGNTNDWTTVAGSPATNQIIVPVDPALPLEFYRLVFP
ncbi:MAG: autotransporter-associated beta strand repeat-containing protein [Verrucomicrobiae bacterium]|nr:autotransporter-associated beta strand repeat-containing protein [Verrucomicrobiae bacterium]